MRFSVLDNSDTENPDFYFVPLVFLESFSAPVAVLQIGEYKIQMPLDWSIALGDKEAGDIEVLPITSLNSRDFKAFCFNPLTTYLVEWPRVDIINVYSEVKWYFPKTKPGQLLCTPLSNTDNPDCVYFIKEISKQCEVIDYGKI
ncbi:uncharacterized protein METZ01_LOCUS423087, partial [marine metagenome]